MSKDIVNLVTMMLRVFIEIYIIEMNREHRNFMFQVFDQIQENLARDGMLEALADPGFQENALINVIQINYYYYLYLDS